MHLNENGVLDIFCDASVTKINGETISSAGCYIPKLNEYDIVITRNSTNNEGEATALYRGILNAVKHKSEYKYINIFSDSKITVYGIREWIFGWKLKDFVFYSSSETPVANQSILLAIINTIIKNDLKVNIWHQKGHVKNSKDAIDSFYVSNGILLNLKQAGYISYNNNVIDKLTRSMLSHSNGNLAAICEDSKYIAAPLYYVPTKEELRHYKYLISDK